MGLFGHSNAHALSLDHEDISQSHDDHLQFQVFQVFTCDKWWKLLESIDAKAPGSHPCHPSHHPWHQITCQVPSLRSSEPAANACCKVHWIRIKPMNDTPVYSMYR